MAEETIESWLAAIDLEEYEDEFRRPLSVKKVK